MLKLIHPRSNYEWTVVLDGKHMWVSRPLQLPSLILSLFSLRRSEDEMVFGRVAL